MIITSVHGLEDSPHCSSCLRVTRMCDRIESYIPNMACDKLCPNRRKYYLDLTLKSLLEGGHIIVVDGEPITLSS